MIRGVGMIVHVETDRIEIENFKLKAKCENCGAVNEYVDLVVLPSAIIVYCQFCEEEIKRLNFEE